MARIAIHYWQDHIAPVFDVGGRLLLIDGHEREEHMLIQNLPPSRAQELAQARVEHLICGAISRPMREAIIHQGIEVTSFVTGEIEAVLTAWTLGQLDSTFTMPGCGGAMRGRLGRGRRQFQQQRRAICHKVMELDQEEWGRRPEKGPGCAQHRKQQVGKGQGRGKALD